MEARKRVSGGIERRGEVFRGKVVQTKKDKSALDGWRLWFGGLLPGLQRRSSGNDGSLEALSDGGREVLGGREPLIEFDIAGDASAENPPLQLGEFELLIADRVVGAERSLGEGNLIVLPGQVAQDKQAIGGELIEGPVAVSLELDNTAAKIVAAGDGGGFREVELCIVGSLQMRMAEVCDLPAGREMRVPGVPLERRNRGRVRAQAELDVGHPCERTAVQQFGVDQAKQQASIVLAAKEGIVHLERSVAGREINRDGLVVPEDLAVADFEMTDGKSKEPLYGSLPGNGAGCSRWKICRAAGIKSYVDHRLLQDDFVEAEFGTKKRADLHAGDDTVHMGERNICGGLPAVYGDSAHVGLQAKGSGMDAGDFDAAAGDTLQFGDEAAADQRLE